MDSSLRQRLLLVERDLLDAIPAGVDAVEQFQERWTSLQNDVHAAIAQSTLSDETIELAHRTASAISILAEGFMNLHNHYEIVRSNQRTDLEAILDRITLTDSADPLVEANTQVRVVLTP